MAGRDGGYLRPAVDAGLRAQISFSVASGYRQKGDPGESAIRTIVTVVPATFGSVSVAFEEVPSQEWKEKVYKPDIKDKWDKLCKRPGYEM
jgi:4-oxalocrotonate tautomerase